MTPTPMTPEREDEAGPVSPDLRFASRNQSMSLVRSMCELTHLSKGVRELLVKLANEVEDLRRALPPQPTGDAEGLSKADRDLMEQAKKWGWPANELLAIIDRLNSRLAEQTKKYAGSFTHDEYHAGCNAIRNERNRAEVRADKAEAALVALHTLLDFEEPMSDAKPWIFEDYSAINAAFLEAYAVVSALSTVAGEEK